MFWIFGINQDVIQVHYNKNIKLLNKNLADVALETSWYVGQSKKHNLVLVVTVLNAKSCFLFITFSNPYLKVSTGQI